MYKQVLNDLIVTCEIVEESHETDHRDYAGGTIEVVSHYLIVLCHEKGKTHYELIIELEGNPGPATAMGQALRHIEWCAKWPLDMLARANLYNLPQVVDRLTELQTMIVFACGCDLNLISEMADSLPKWDLEDGRYAILDIDDKSEYEDEDDS